MDEMVNTNEVVEETTDVAEEAVEEVSDAEFDAIWDSDDDSPMFAETDSEAEADQPSEEQTQTEETQPTEAEQPQAESPDQDYLELKHLDEVKRVNKEEAKVLAQKGMDYDRIRGKLGEAENAIQQLQKYESFLNEIKGDFATLDDLMNDTRARVKADKEGISYDEALTQVREANQPKQESNAQQADIGAVIQQIRKQSYLEFAQAYPNVEPKDIPEEVWKDMDKTNNLLASYVKYEAKKLKDENAVLKKNAENKSRSVGSMKSSGNSGLEKSEFDRILEDDDW